MKKLIIILLILALLLTACGRREVTKPIETAEPTENQDDIDRANNDPGPPYGCHFDRMEDYFRLSDAIDDPDVDIVALLAEISGYESISERNRVEMVCEWIERVPYPELEGYDFYQLSIEYRDWDELSGNVTYYLGEEDNLIILTFNPLSAEDGTGGEAKIKIKDSNHHPDDKTIRYFSAEVDGVLLRVIMHGETEKEARETLESMKFRRISELREENWSNKKESFGSSEDLVTNLALIYQQEGEEEAAEQYYNYSDLYADMETEEVQFCEEMEFHQYTNGDILCIMEHAMEYGLREDLNEKEVAMEFAERMKAQTGMDYVFDDCFYYWALLFSEDTEAMLKRYDDAK